MTLLKPFKWEIKLTPELGDAVLSEYIPIFSKIIGSDEPLVLEIDPKDFSMPITQFKIENMYLAKGTISLGKVHFKNEGDLKTVINLVKPIEHNELVIWFTPQYFHLIKGLLHLKRLDMLIADRYSLATWGEIDLLTEKLNLTVGLGTETLKYAFNISDLEPNYMFQIPIKGQSGKIDINTTKVTARIGALIARTQSNSTGKLMGGILILPYRETLTPLRRLR